MAANPIYYTTQSYYYSRVRLLLQDEIEPYRYTDDTLTWALNGGLVEMERLRPDIFLDAKYQAPLQKGDLSRGYEGLAFSGNSLDTELIPVPSNWALPLVWYATGAVQLLDVTDTQDQRAGAFMGKFQTAMLSLTA